MSLETYQAYEPKLLKDAMSKFKEVLDVYIDDDLGWFPMSNPESPLAKALNIHGPPVCKIIFHVLAGSQHAEYSNYIFADGYADGYLPDTYKEVCNNWLKFVNSK